MFSSFSSFSNPFRLPRFLSGSASNAVNIKSVQIHDVETLHEKRARTLKHLLKLNHVNHSLLYNQLRFHNHEPHFLGSAYLMGADSNHLNNVYDQESKELEPWHDSPGEISTSDWREYIGKHEYQRAYVDFFEDELVLNGYDWRKVLEEYLFQGKAPLINNLIAGIGHPLIHLGYAFEISSREVAMEALSMAASSYNFLHRYLDDPSYSKPTSNSTQSPLEILCRVRTDKRFDGLFTHKGAEHIGPLFEQRESALLEHWNSWHIADPTREFKASQLAAAALLVAPHKPGDNQYDFYLVHILTTSHAVRILLPLIPTKFQIPLVRQWWLLTLTMYITQLRPEVRLTAVTDYDRKNKDWVWVYEKALHGEHALDAHYVKALRAMKTAADTWGDNDEFYLKAAVRLAEEFDGWGGLGSFEAASAHQ
ncbi:MAG: hypothetical protein Q9212_001009 [Teloschistes hypoglaucus]